MLLFDVHSAGQSIDFQQRGYRAGHDAENARPV